MKYKIGIALFVSFLLLSGCKAVPVVNIEQAPIVTSASNASSEDIAKAIITAGNSLGWIMKQNSSNEISGVLNLRDHMAKISIKYTSGFYSINYVDSQNLKYDGTNIHKNYNGWVMNLNKMIKTRLSYL